MARKLAPVIAGSVAYPSGGPHERSGNRDNADNRRQTSTIRGAQGPDQPVDNYPVE
jgi:hypothetical protein